MPQAVYTFGDFDLDTAQFELRRAGGRVKLERIPLELLILFAERGGNLVSRPEIVERLWGKDVFVDTEHGINTAVRRIRAALGKDSDQPRFLFTVPGKGYRLVVDAPGAPATEPAADSRTSIPVAVIESLETGVLPPHASARRRSSVGMLAVVIVAIVASAAIAGLWARGRARAALHAPARSIAVLPLVNLTGDASQEYFADGITDELTTMLAKRTALRVISRTTAMQYKGSHRPLPEHCARARLDVIVEGSIARMDGEVHVAVQLIDASRDAHIWADSFNRNLESLYLVPVNLSGVIAQKLGVAAAPAGPARRVSPEAHDAYLRGRYFWFSDRLQSGARYHEAGGRTAAGLCSRVVRPRGCVLGACHRDSGARPPRHRHAAGGGGEPPRTRTRRPTGGSAQRRRRPGVVRRLGFRSGG